MFAPRNLGVLFLLLGLLAPRPSAAQLGSDLLQTSWTVDDGVEVLSGQGVWDLGEGAEPWIGFGDATSQLTGTPAARVVWLPEIVLATQAWRWISAAAPASPTPGQVSGTVLFDFGVAGSFLASADINLANGTAFLDFDITNLDLLALPALQSGDWVEVQDLWTGGEQGTATSEGCIVIQGRERATFSGSWFDDVGVDGSQLPAVRVDAALQATFSPDEKTLDWVGDLRLGEARSIQFGVNIDVGNGPIFVGLGVASIGASPEADRLPLSFYHDLQLQAGPALLRMLETWWIQMWGRVSQPHPAWPLGPPDQILATAQFDLGSAGTVTATADIFFLQDFVDVDLDFANYTGEGLPAAGSAFDARWRERLVGVGGNTVDGKGNLYANGTHFGSFESSYLFVPGVDTTTLPTLVLDTTMALQETNQGLRIDAEGSMRKHEGANLDLVHQLDLGVHGNFASTSIFQVEPFVDPGDPDPQYGGVSFDGTLQLAGSAYPSPFFVVLDLLDLSYWLRRSFRPGSFPPAAADSSFTDFRYDLGLAGQLNVRQWLDGETDDVESDAEADEDGIDLSLLPNVGLLLHIDVIEEIFDNPNLVVGCVVADSLKQPTYLVADREVPRRKEGNTHIPFKMILSATVAFDAGGTSATITGTARFETFDTTPVPEPSPSVFAMGPAHPNPSSRESRVELALPRPSAVRARVVDLRGRVVRELMDGMLGTGSHSLHWDGRDSGGSPVAAGTYWLRVRAADQVLTRKIVRLER